MIERETPAGRLPMQIDSSMVYSDFILVLNGIR